MAREARSQREQILGLLRAHGTVSAHDLTYRHGITRAAARIWELRQEGYVIETGARMTSPGEKRAQAIYTLVSEPSGAPAGPAVQETLGW
jgi:predicted ArsR family transcriptional regulator